MLVQVSFTNIESLATNFDENQNRTTPHIRYATWKEYIVAWRKDRLELYTDHVRTIACFNLTNIIQLVSVTAS